MSVKDEVEEILEVLKEELRNDSYLRSRVRAAIDNKEEVSLAVLVKQILYKFADTIGDVIEWVDDVVKRMMGNSKSE